MFSHEMTSVFKRWRQKPVFDGKQLFVYVDVLNLKTKQKQKLRKTDTVICVKHTHDDVTLFNTLTLQPETETFI